MKAVFPHMLSLDVGWLPGIASNLMIELLRRIMDCKVEGWGIYIKI